jgi:hypothetical protein
MPLGNGDNRDISEIRADGDEMSVANAYTQHHLNTSQPGLTPEQRGEFAIEDDWQLTADEDDPRWYEQDDDDYSYEQNGATPEPPIEEPFVYAGIEFPSEQAAYQWAEEQANPERAAVLGVIDNRIREQLGGLEAAQQWAQEGRAQRAAVENVREIQQNINDQDNGTQIAQQIVDRAVDFHGVPSSDYGDVLSVAEGYFEEAALNYLNNGGTPEGWAAVQQQAAAQCVEAATIALGRARISHEALKKV